MSKKNINSQLNARLGIGAALRLVSIIAVASIWLTSCAGVRTLRTDASAGIVRITVEEFTRLAGAQNAITLNVTGQSDQIILLRDDQGFYRAISSRCTHLGCQVRPASNLLVCPCHGSVFDREGTVKRGPAPDSLPTFPVEVVGDEIEIKLTDAGGTR